jgi:hypothetical protein
VSVDSLTFTAAHTGGPDFTHAEAHSG